MFGGRALKHFGSEMCVHVRSCLESVYMYVCDKQLLSDCHC